MRRQPPGSIFGKTTRRRLNRGGDRQANAALYRIAISRLRWDNRTRDYLTRRITEGKPAAKPSAASSDTSPARSTKSSHPHPKRSRQLLDIHRGISPEVIHYTLETLGAFIGPLFGVLIADYYLVRRQRVVVDDLFTMSPGGRYWYRGGYHPPAIIATAMAAAIAMVPVLWTHGPGMTIAVQYTWFIGMAVGLGIYLVIGRKAASVPVDAR